MKKKLRIALLNIHGLLKGSGLEIGRDSDNGGQTKYLYELAEALSQHEHVEHVHIFTRLIDDPELSPEYATPIEILNEKLDIRRIAFGGKRYKMKEQLWEHLDDFVNGAVQHIKAHNIFPDWIHSHYGDAGYCAVELSTILNVPFAHTGHSLGMHKQSKLLATGMTPDEAEKKFKFSHRIMAEEAVLAMSEFIVTSTEQEISTYDVYENCALAQYNVLPPGIDTTKFTPYYQKEFKDKGHQQEELQRKYWVSESIEKFLSNPHKPVIMALSRPDRRKNLNYLIEVYGKDKELQSLANLVIFAGIRKDINTMPPSEKEVLTNILLSMDKYDLYGKLAIPKKHDVENEVATIYKYCAEKRGVFVNLTDHENFGLTLIEAASTGLPVVATKNGGPAEIIPKCENGFLVDPNNFDEIKSSLVEVLTREEKWKNFSNNGILNVQKYFSWESHVDTYMKWVTENLENSRGIGIKKKKYPEVNTGRLRNNINKLFATDIDGTLISPEHDHPGIERLKKYLENRSKNTAFALATGRNLPLVREVLEDFDLPIPDVVISSVGTEIHYLSESHEFVQDKGWAKYLSSRWDREAIATRLSSIPWLTLQEEEAQNPFKISYYYKEGNFNEDQIRQVLGRLYPQVSVIPSHGTYLDILPKRASKGNAIKFLCQKWSIPMQNVYAAGDSGNDLDMFRGPIKGIVVGNRSPELKDLNPKKNLYLATSFAAEGICEGLEHYGYKL